MKTNPNYQKYIRGQKLTGKELSSLSLLDKIRYVMHHGKDKELDSMQVYHELVKLGAINRGTTLVDVYNVIQDYYGDN